MAISEDETIALLQHAINAHGETAPVKSSGPELKDSLFHDHENHKYSGG